MKTQTTTKLIIRTSLAAALALAASLPTVVTAAEEPMKPMKGGEHQMMVNPVDSKSVADSGDKMMMTKSNMMERCTAMKEQKEKMMSDIQTQNQELSAQIAKMNLAPADKKLDLMAAVVTRMNDQQTIMDARKAKMEQDMMKHMMMHMQMGDESVMQCPMMKGMADMDKKLEGDHKDLHAQ